MTLLGMPHCGTTMGDNVTRDIHYDVTMDNDYCYVYITGITMDNDVAMNLFCYVLLHKIMILLFHQQILLNYTHKPLKSTSNQ